MLRGATLLTVVGLVLAGCVDNRPNEQGVADGLPTGLPSEAQLAERTLESPPQIFAGEWWEYEVTAAFQEEPLHIRLVAAGLENGTLLVGVPAETTDVDVDQALLFHLPGIGELSTDTLGWDIHDLPFAPVTFPLEVESSWNTMFYENDFAAEVVSIEGSVATIRFSPSGDPSPRSILLAPSDMTLEYDARVGMMTNLDAGGYQVTLLDHGFNHEGGIMVPVNQDLVFLHGLAGPAANANLEPQLMMETVEIETAYDEMSIAYLLGPPREEAGSGDYYVSATDPQGNVFTESYTAVEGGEYTVRFERRSGDPQGSWDLEYRALGAGLAIFEAVAWDRMVIEL